VPVVVAQTTKWRGWLRGSIVSVSGRRMPVDRELANRTVKNTGNQHIRGGVGGASERVGS
jgi:hypothetical protein